MANSETLLLRQLV
ncbi:hypothetical protein YPPY06_2221, partial [Yersinia pestis PY-06]